MPWRKLQVAIAAADEVATHPAHLATADHVGAFLRDAFDDFDVPLTDDRTLYVAMVTVGLVSHLMNRSLTPAELESAGTVLGYFQAGLTTHAPAAARP